MSIGLVVLVGVWGYAMVVAASKHIEGWFALLTYVVALVVSIMAVR